MASDRKPWPMKWIVLAMILFIVPYTYLTLHYRKPGRSYEPYEDAKEKTLIARAGFRRVSLPAAQAASPRLGDAVGLFAAISASSGGLPDELRTFLIDTPLIPAAIGAVSAPAIFDSSKPYSIRYVCAASDLHQALSGAHLYIKGNEAYLITNFDRLADGLSTRTEQGTVEVEIRPGTFDRGKYRLTIIGQNASRTWQMEVR